MKIIVHFLVVLAFIFNSCTQNKTTQEIVRKTTLSLNIDSAKTTISPEVYGHFSEHLGTCIYEGIYVGENSSIPNIKGYRTDVVEAMKALKVPVLRWPGGCFADTYHWKDGIGPKKDRPSIVNVYWGGVTEDNSFGTHEFLDFCELIGREPYLSSNVGCGTVQEAAEWVEYVTSSNQSPMTDLRKKNGREEPWDVKFWGIGNENWGCGGEMDPAYYANLYRQFACYVKGNNLQRVICGPSGGDNNWTEKIMSGLGDKQYLAQGVSLHYYTLPTGSWSGSKGSSTEFGEEMYFKTIQQTLKIRDYIDETLEIMDKYDPKGNIKLIVDEWGTWYDKLEGTKDGFLQQQNTVRDALEAGINLNIFNNHADRISMANIAQIVNVLQAIILTKKEQMVLTPTYHVFKMYNVHQGATLIPSELKTVNYEYEGESIPAVSASASSKDGIVNITLLNVNPNEAITVECDLGKEGLQVISGKVVSGNEITDYNDFGEEEKVTIKDFEVTAPVNDKLNIEIPAHSVVLVQLK
jgi:alpha-N-arabinofuranosidase